MSEKTKNFLEATAAVLLVFGAGFLNVTLLIIVPIAAPFLLLIGYAREKYLKHKEEKLKQQKDEWFRRMQYSNEDIIYREGDKILDNWKTYGLEEDWDKGEDWDD